MSLNGAVCGFILIYIIPIYIHFSNLFANHSNNQDINSYENQYIQDFQIEKLNSLES